VLPTSIGYLDKSDVSKPQATSSPPLVPKPVKEVHKVVEVWEKVEGQPRRLVERRSVTVFDLTEE
jgi:hypothetical protein